MITFKRISLITLMAATVATTSNLCAMVTQAPATASAPINPFEQLPNEILQLIMQHGLRSSVSPTTYQSARDAFQWLAALRCVDQRFRAIAGQVIPTQTEMNNLANYKNPAYRLWPNDDAVTIAAALGKCYGIYVTHTPALHLHFGRTGSAAHYAAYFGQHAALAILISLNPLYLKVMDGDNKTPLHIALEQGHTGCVRTFVQAKKQLILQQLPLVLDALPPAIVAQRAAIQAEVDFWQSIQTTAERGKFADALTQLRQRNISENTEDNLDTTALIRAAEDDNYHEITTLLATPGINVNTQDTRGRTALHWVIWAIFNGNYSDLDIVQALLAAPGINVNAQNDDGWTALSYAAFYGLLTVVKALLAMPDINANAQNNNGCTALYTAAGKGNFDIVTTLLATPGINVNVKTNFNSTPLDEAVDTGHIPIIKALLKAPGIARTTVQHAQNSLVQKINYLTLPETENKYFNYLEIAKVLQDFLKRQPTAPIPTASSSTPTPQHTQLRSIQRNETRHGLKAVVSREILRSQPYFAKAS